MRSYRPTPRPRRIRPRIIRPRIIKPSIVRPSIITPRTLRLGLRRLGATVLIGCGLLAIVIIGETYIATVFTGAQHTCIVDGPSPTGAQWERILRPGEAMEEVVPAGSFILFPLGRACDYRLADGSGAIRVTAGDWGQTRLVAMLVGGAIAGGILVALGRSGRCPEKESSQTD